MRRRKRGRMRRWRTEELNMKEMMMLKRINVEKMKKKMMKESIHKFFHPSVRPSIVKKER